MTDNISISALGKYRYSNDYVFMIEPEIGENVKKVDEEYVTNNSPYLYIRKEEYDAILQNRPIDNIDYTPLKNLIDNGFIEIDKKESEIKISFKKTRSGNFEYEYYKFNFFRTLKDKRHYNKNGKLYKKHENQILLNENDCLGFSECMTVVNYKPDKELFEKMIGVIDVTSEEEANKGKGGVEPVLQVKGTTSIFGDKTEDNIRLAKQFPEDNKNHKAKPAVGESYAIVNTIDDRTTPYHIAFVLCKDKNLNITIETFAEKGDNFLVKFNIYDTVNSDYSFHTANEHHFEESTTIVLESRDLNHSETGLSKIEADIQARKEEYEAETARREKKARIPEVNIAIPAAATKKKNASVISEEYPIIIPNPSVRSNKTIKRTVNPSVSRNKTVFKSIPSFKKNSIPASMNRGNTRKKTKI